jgi:hypothetical protein
MPDKSKNMFLYHQSLIFGILNLGIISYLREGYFSKVLNINW